MKKTNQASQKVANYIDNFIESDYFQDFVMKTRIKFKIPVEGFVLSKKERGKLEKLYDMDIFHVPVQIKKKELKITKQLNLSLNFIVKDLLINNLKIKQILRLYLFYNEKFLKLLESDFHDMGLCMVKDAKDQIDEYSLLFGNDNLVDIFRKNTDSYPVNIILHPSISQRDLIDFIRNKWTLIDFYLKKYKKENSKLGKLRTRNPLIKKRDKFIYNNRHSPHKDIVLLVANEFPEEVSGPIDEGSVGKIISLEKKRRKEV